MSKFELKTRTFQVRGQDVTVRELTQAQRNTFTEMVQADRYRGPALLVSLGLVFPVLTEEEAKEEPADAMQEIVSAIMDLSNMGAKNGGSPEKEPDAG